MNDLYYRYIDYRIKNMDVECAALYLSNTNLSKVQKMRLLMNKGLNAAEAEATFLTAYVCNGGK